MAGILLLAAAVVMVLVFVGHHYRRDGMPPKAQLLSDTWEIAEGKRNSDARHQRSYVSESYTVP